MIRNLLAVSSGRLRRPMEAEAAQAAEAENLAAEAENLAVVKNLAAVQCQTLENSW